MSCVVNYHITTVSISWSYQKCGCQTFISALGTDNHLVTNFLNRITISVQFLDTKFHIMLTFFPDRLSYTNIQVLPHRKQDSFLLQRWINSYCWGKLSVFVLRMVQDTKYTGWKAQIS